MSNKFTKSQLEKIIKEEIRKIVSETSPIPMYPPGIVDPSARAKLKKPTYIEPEETPLQLADIVNIICSKINSIDIPGILKIPWIENKIIPDVNELIGVITSEMPPMNTAVPRPRGIDLIIRVEEILNTLENMPVPMINDMYQIPGIGPIGPEVVPPEDEGIDITEQSRSSGRGYATAAKRIVTKLLSQAIPSLTVAYVVKLLIQALCRGSISSPGAVPVPTPGPNTTPSGGGSDGSCRQFNRLAVKVTGENNVREAVKVIQAMLVNLGHSVKRDEIDSGFGPGSGFKSMPMGNANFKKAGIDGRCGPGTQGAVERFQKSNNLKVDGLVGPETWPVLSSGGVEKTIKNTEVPLKPSLDNLAVNTGEEEIKPASLREVKDQLSKWKKLWS